MNFYPFHVGDYAVHTRHLTLMEDLAYRRLLDLYYTKEAALPADVAQVARLIGMREHQAEVAAVLEEFFTRGDDEHWVSVRCETEIDRMREKQAKAKASAQASVAARSAKAKPTLSERSTTAELPIPRPTPEEEKGAIAPSSPAEPPTADAPALSAVVPACPHLELIALFTAKVPDMPHPRPEAWDGAKAEAMRARWKWILTAKRASGERYATSKAEALEWFGRFFDNVQASDFLTGRSNRGGKFSLEWLMKKDNFDKVVQGNYENRKAA